MLTKKFQPNDVISIKLSTGEELIARYLGNDDDLAVKSPMAIVPHGQGIAMAPYMLSTDHSGSLHISSNHVLSIAGASSEVANQYILHTTGLAMPTQ